MQKLTNAYRVLNAPSIVRTWTSDILLFFPRFICGIMLAFDFGAAKFGMPWSPADKKLGLFEVAYWFPQDVAEYGGIFALFPAFFAWMGAFSEAVGGLFFALGFNTRIFSFLIACTMLVAIVWQQWDNGTWNLLPALGFFWVALYNMVLGPGKLSIDYLMYNQYKNNAKR